ncbi:MAG: hypothetical protein ACE5E0_00025 [Terriglobia bacterium]
MLRGAPRGMGMTKLPEILGAVLLLVAVLGVPGTVRSNDYPGTIAVPKVKGVVVTRADAQERQIEADAKFRRAYEQYSDGWPGFEMSTVELARLSDGLLSALSRGGRADVAEFVGAQSKEHKKLSDELFAYEGRLLANGAQISTLFAYASALDGTEKRKSAVRFAKKAATENSLAQDWARAWMSELAERQKLNGAVRAWANREISTREVERLSVAIDLNGFEEEKKRAVVQRQRLLDEKQDDWARVEGLLAD